MQFYISFTHIIIYSFSMCFQTSASFFLQLNSKEDILKKTPLISIVFFVPPGFHFRVNCPFKISLLAEVEGQTETIKQSRTNWLKHLRLLYLRIGTLKKQQDSKRIQIEVNENVSCSTTVFGYKIKVRFIEFWNKYFKSYVHTLANNIFNKNVPGFFQSCSVTGNKLCLCEFR